MIEKVARAIDPWAWDEFNAAEETATERRADSKIVASRVIEAMRKPCNVRLLAAAAEALPEYDLVVAENCIAAYIDKALEGTA